MRCDASEAEGIYCAFTNRDEVVPGKKCVMVILHKIVMVREFIPGERTSCRTLRARVGCGAHRRYAFS